MSGGSMNYLYQRVDDAPFSEHTALRRAFRAHLVLVARAMKAIEWVDSSDCADGTEEEAIRAVIGPHGELRQAIADAHAARDAIDAVLAKMEPKA